MNSSSFLGLGDLGISYLGIDVDIGADSEWISKGSASSNFRTNTLKNTLVKSSGIANLAWSSSFFKNSDLKSSSKTVFKVFSNILKNTKYTSKGAGYFFILHSESIDGVFYSYGISEVNLKSNTYNTVNFKADGSAEVLFKINNIVDVSVTIENKSITNLLTDHVIVATIAAAAKASLKFSNNVFQNSETVTLGIASSDFKTISYINSRFVTLGTDRVIFDGQSVINLKMDTLGKSEVLFKTTHIRNVVMNVYGSSEVNLIGYHYYGHLPLTHRRLIRPEELRKVLSLIENRNSTHGIKGRTTIRNIENYTEMMRYFK